MNKDFAKKYALCPLGALRPKRNANTRNYFEMIEHFQPSDVIGWNDRSLHV